MLLVNIVADLNGVSGRQVRYAIPQSVQEALTIAPSVREAEMQERFSEIFYTRFDNSVILSHRGHLAS